MALAARNRKGIKVQSIWEPGFRNSKFRRNYALLYSMLSRNGIGIWLYSRSDSKATKKTTMILININRIN
jgi:hypothetical protein